MSRRQARPSPAGALFLFVALLACNPADRSASRADSGHATADATTCLVAPPLAGVRLGDSGARVRAALGQPRDSVRSADEVITYRFPQAEVRLARHYVDRIVATEPGGWPRGLAVGSTRSEVDEYTLRHRLLRMTTGGSVAGDTIEIVVCPDDRTFLYITPPASGRRVDRVELVAGRG